MVIYIVNNYSPTEMIGGSEIQCWLLAKYLAKKGHKTSYLAMQGISGKEEAEGEGFKIRYLSAKKGSRLSAFINFYRLLKKEKPDICYLRTFRYLFFLNLIRSILGIPAVFNTSNLTDCDPSLEKIEFSLNLPVFFASLRSSMIRRLNFASLNKLPLITITKYHPQLLKEKYNINVQAFPVYNFMEDEYEKNRTVKQKRIVSVNNLKPRKNPEAFIKLAERFKDSGYEFLMVGNIQSNFDYYQKMVREAESRLPNFKYLGGKSIAEVNKILASSMVFVNTCSPEGFGNNFIQAWLNECPTVTLQFDPDGIIEANKIGFHSGSIDQMAVDLEKLMANGQLLEEMGKKARLYALANHSVANVDKYEEIFKEIAHEND